MASDWNSNQSGTEFINGLITKTNGADKVVDFRDGLVLASPKDYAMLHGAGGKKHNAVSVVKVTVCDYSKGKGQGSVTVSSNLELSVISLLRAVAENRMLTNPQLVSAMGSTVSSAPTPQKKDGILISEDTFNEIGESLRIVVNAAKQKQTTLGQDEFVALGKKLRNIFDTVKAAKETEQKNPDVAPPVKPGNAAKNLPPDFVHTQQRVNIYKQGKDGLPPDVAPVNKTSITHKAYRDDGSLSQYPWTIKITNGNAKVRTGDNGSTTYDSASFQKTGEAFIIVSDADMFRMMDECQRYIDAYTMCYGIPLIREGKKEQARQREEWSSNQT